MRKPNNEVFTPSLEYLARCGSFMLDCKGMAAFLGVSTKRLEYLACTDRIPRPLQLGLGKCRRWSVLKLLEWVEAGCPRSRYGNPSGGGA